MFAVFPEILHLTEKGDPEALALLVRKYFGENQMYSPRLRVGDFYRNAGIELKFEEIPGYARLEAWDNKGQYVLQCRLNPRFPNPTEQNYALAHMLGHVFFDLHPRMANGELQRSIFEEKTSPAERIIKNPASRNRAEQLADQFAMGLLLPRGMLRKACSTLTSVEDVAAFFHVDALVLIRRLEQLGMIEEPTTEEETYENPQAAAMSNTLHPEEEFPVPEPEMSAEPESEHNPWDAFDRDLPPLPEPAESEAPPASAGSVVQNARAAAIQNARAAAQAKDSRVAPTAPARDSRVAPTAPAQNARAAPPPPAQNARAAPPPPAQNARAAPPPPARGAGMDPNDPRMAAARANQAAQKPAPQNPPPRNGINPNDPRAAAARANEPAQNSGARAAPPSPTRDPGAAPPQTTRDPRVAAQNPRATGNNPQPPAAQDPRSAAAPAQNQRGAPAPAGQAPQPKANPKASPNPKDQSSMTRVARNVAALSYRREDQRSTDDTDDGNERPQSKGLERIRQLAKKIDKSVDS